MNRALLCTRLVTRKALTCRISSSCSFLSKQSFSKAANSSKTTKSVAPFVVGVTVLASIAVGFSVYEAPSSAQTQAQVDSPKLAKIRLADVKKHGRDADAKWVIRGTKVYDITEWISGHPGGEIILCAVGGTIDAYWDIFSIHKKQDVYDILEQYYIGDLDPQDLLDGKVPSANIDDPFKSDPQRDPRLLVHTERPCNAETAPDCLATYITPHETFYVRNHLWVPTANEDEHVLHVELHDGTEKDYSISDLKTKFERVTITATLQCSGNRRKHMTEEARAASGLQWEVGAISNAEWTGARLRDVLSDAGFPVDNWPNDEVKHAQFTGSEAYGSSIPIEKAVSPRGDVLLVYEMGGKPLPPDHGYPLRALVPGHVAARSVKWLNKIVLSEDESPCQWQQRDYKCFGPNVCSQDVNWASAPAIQEMPVQSAITAVRSISCQSMADRKLLQSKGLKEDEDAVEISGYAFSGGGRAIVRVDVSADDGRTWHQAEFLPEDDDKAPKGHKSWAWRRWKWVTPKQQAGKGGAFVVKAIDEGYNVQPESYEACWNFRGNLTSSWHRVGFEGENKG